MDRIALQILEDGWEHDAGVVAEFDGWCKTFLATVRERYRDELGPA